MVYTSKEFSSFPVILAFFTYLSAKKKYLYIAVISETNTDTENLLYLTRGKIILEQLSRPRFFPTFEISRSSLRAKHVGKRAGNKTRKKRGLESCSNIFFPLVLL